MLQSKQTYHIKIRTGKHQGYEVKVEQLCIIFGIFKFWGCIRTKDCTTSNNVSEYICKLEKTFGVMDIIDQTKSLI